MEVVLPIVPMRRITRRAWDSALRPKRCLLAANHKVRDIAASKLILDWIARAGFWMAEDPKIQYPDDESNESVPRDDLALEEAKCPVPERRAPNHLATIRALRVTENLDKRVTQSLALR